MTNGSGNTQTILMLGGTGKTDRRVVERLLARDVPVRVGSRSGEPPFDWEDRATWAPALHGASAAYVSFFSDLAVAGAAEAASRWTSYVADWTAWNHVRGAAALGAAVLLAVAVAVR